MPSWHWTLTSIVFWDIFQTFQLMAYGYISYCGWFHILRCFLWDGQLWKTAFRQFAHRLQPHFFPSSSLQDLPLFIYWSFVALTEKGYCTVSTCLFQKTTAMYVIWSFYCIFVSVTNYMLLVFVAIFLDVTRVLCELELTIHKVKVTTTPDGRVLDLFYITDNMWVYLWLLDQCIECDIFYSVMVTLVNDIINGNDTFLLHNQLEVKKLLALLLLVFGPLLAKSSPMPYGFCYIICFNNVLFISPIFLCL